MTSRTISSGKTTFINMTTKRKLEVYISSNLPTIQIYDSNDNSYTPNWSATRLTLRADIYLDSKLITSGVTYSWKRKSNIESDYIYS